MQAKMDNLEPHDSAISKITTGARQTVISFEPAYLRKSTARPGIDPRTGWPHEVVEHFPG